MPLRAHLPKLPRREEVVHPQVLVGFDIETHDWVRKTDKGRIGQFGWYTLKEEYELRFARIVQLGWVVGQACDVTQVSTKTYTVRPIDFTIADDAARFHRISQDIAMHEGQPLEKVLSATPILSKILTPQSFSP